MGYFKKNKSDRVALDISSSSIKILHLKSAGGQDWTVEGIGSATVSRSMLSDKTVNDPEALSEAIGEALRKNNIRVKRAVAAMPYSQARVSNLDMPSGLGEIEQEDHVQMEAAGQLDFPVEQVRLDFNVIGKSAGGDAMNVRMVAVKNDTPYQSRVSAVEDAGLTLDIMDIESFAIERAARWLIERDPINQRDAIEAFVDIGHEFMSLDVIQNGKSIYTREQNFGIKHLTDEVAKRYGMPVEQARNELVNNTLPETFHHEILPQFRSEVATQVNRIIQFFFAGTNSNRVHRIWLAGGGASIVGMDKEILEATGVTTRIANPFQYTYAGSDVDAAYLRKMGPSYLVAFGLAIRSDEGENYNLMPWREQRRKSLQKDFLSKIGVAAAAAAGLSILAGIAMSGAIDRQEDRNKYLADQIVIAEKDLAEIEELESKKELAMARKNVIETLQGNRDQLAQVFLEMSRAAEGKGIVFESMEHKGGMVEIEGRAGSNSVVATYLTDLGKSPWIKNPEIVLIEAKDDAAENKDDPRTDIYMPYQFIIKTGLRNPNIPEIIVDADAVDDGKKDKKNKKKKAEK